MINPANFTCEMPWVRNVATAPVTDVPCCQPGEIEAEVDGKAYLVCRSCAIWLAMRGIATT